MNKRDFYLFRESVFKRIFLVTDLIKKGISFLNKITGPVFPVSVMLFAVLVLFHIGFYQSEIYDFKIRKLYYILFVLLYFSKGIILITRLSGARTRILVYDILLLVTCSLVFVGAQIFGTASQVYFWIKQEEGVLIFISIWLILSEIKRLLSLINSLNLSPSLLFVVSFLLIILTGSGLLMFPNSRNEPITYLEALFTSVSAVCVTGLTIVDISSTFTATGQIIILVLIQTGALGIMTFTGFLGYIFTGSASIRERYLLRDILSSENLGSLFKVLIKIMGFTLLIELTGAMLIFLNTPEIQSEKMFFSLFHSVSAFCNAGFSTLSGGMNTAGIKDNFAFHGIIGMLIILGGIGFPVLLAGYHFFKQFIRLMLLRIRKQKGKIHKSFDVQFIMVISTTIVLLFSGTLFYFLFESGKSLEGMGFLQKFGISLFGSISARTAGFNITDITLWSYPTVFLMIILMWIGASPGSTGGGIKTITFAVALASIYQFARGNKSVEIRNRKIGSSTIMRVLSVIVVSIVFIFSGFTGLLLYEPDKNPVYLLFESFSAFGTVGLSLANTATLSPQSHWILIFLMFTGRVGPLTLLTAILIPERKKYHKFPSHELIIN